MSCGGDGGNGNSDLPTPGNLTLTLDASAPAGAGAVMLTVSGGTRAIDTVVVSGGYTSYLRRLGPGSFRAVLVGPLVGGALAAVHVPDTRKGIAICIPNAVSNDLIRADSIGSAGKRC